MTDPVCSPPHAVPDLRDRPWQLSHLGLALLTSVAAWSCVTLINGLVGLLTDSTSDIPYHLTPVIAPLVLHLPAMAAIGVMCRRLGVTLEEGFGITDRSFPGRILMGIGACLAILPLVWLSALASHTLYMLAGGGPPEAQPAIQMMTRAAEHSPWVVVLTVVQAVLVAPVVEEAVFRGLAMPALSKRMGLLPAAAAVSAVFAVIHGHPPAYAPLFILSMGLCFAYARTGSLLVPIAMHSCFNLIPVAMVLLNRIL